MASDMGGAMGAMIIGQAATDILQNVASGVSAKQSYERQKKLLEKQYGFQRLLRTSAYQDAVYDLKQAGLNPALAYVQGAAPTLGVSAPSVAMMRPDISGSVGRVLASGRQAGVLADQVATVRANREKAEADARYAGPRYDAEIDLMDANAARSFEEAKLAISQERKTDAERLRVDVDRMLGEALLPAARAEMELDVTEEGQLLRKFRRIMDSVSPFIGGARAGGARRR